jgi:hypothetical protein
MGAGTIYNCLLKGVDDGRHKNLGIVPADIEEPIAFWTACGSWGRRHSAAPTTSGGGRRGADAGRPSTGLGASA